MTMAIPVSIKVGLIIFFNEFLFTIPTIKRKLRDMPIEYATNSSVPKGVAKRDRGEILDKVGSDDIIVLNAAPVDHAVYEPHAIPNAGTNITNATEALWENIPIASIPSVWL